MRACSTQAPIDSSLRLNANIGSYVGDRLWLLKPPFFSTDFDFFGPYTVTIGRCSEKRWGVIFECLTTRCVHLDLLNSIDTDAFLLALRGFIARQGTPFEIISDQGTNFRGAERELRWSHSCRRDWPRNKFRFIHQQLPTSVVPGSVRYNPTRRLFKWWSFLRVSN